MFAGTRYSLILSLLCIVTGYAFVVAPVLVAALCLLMLAAGASGEWWGLLAVPSMTIWATQVTALMFICRSHHIPAAYALTTPLGLSLFYTALSASTFNILRGRGVAWKERQVYGRAGARLPVREGRAVSPPTTDNQTAQTHTPS